MSPRSRNFWRVFSLWAILMGPVVSGADDDDERPPAEDAQANGRAAHEAQFDQWIFQANVRVLVLRGNGRVAENSVAASARVQVDSQLKVRLDELMRDCHLNEAQQRKLALAGRGDIKRFFDQVEEVRKKFLAVRNDQDRLNQVWQEIGPLQQQFSSGLFGEQSLFAKVQRTTLTEEQQAKYQAALLVRRRSDYDVAIAKVLPTLGIGLRQEQCDSLRKLLVNETPPPLLFGQHDSQVVMFGLSKVPTAKLKGVLDKEQWKQLQPILLNASAMEDQLAQLGVIEEPKPNSGVIVKSVRTVVAPQNASKAK